MMIPFGFRQELISQWFWVELFEYLAGSIEYGPLNGHSAAQEKVS